jgi:hypothetical protein
MNLSELLDRIESKIQRLAHKSLRLESDLAALEEENQRLKAEIAQKEIFIAVLKDALSNAANDAHSTQIDAGHLLDTTAMQIDRQVQKAGNPIDWLKKTDR